MHCRFRNTAFWVPGYRNILNDVTNEIPRKNLNSFSQEEKFQFFLSFLLKNWERFAHFEGSSKMTLRYLQLEEWKYFPRTVLFARSTSVFALFSSEISAVSKEVANLSLNLTVFDLLISLLFLHVPENCTEPQILMLACLQKTKPKPNKRGKLLA